MFSWGNYWKENPKLFTIVMEKSTAFVAEKLLEHHLVDETTHLLDFGCGPGYLANALKGKLNTYYGVDIAEQYIKIAAQKCSDYPNFNFSVLPLDQSLSSLNVLKQDGKQFDTIIILSVIQYFNQKDEVVEMLNQCKNLLKPNGKIILADVIENEKGVWKDILSILIDSIKKHYLLSFIQFIFRAKLSKYNTIRKANQLFMLSKADVSVIAEQVNLTYTILPSITLQTSRVSYCFRP